jgi:hypothetical protein
VRTGKGITADAGSNPPNWLAIFCSAYESFVQDTVVAAVEYRMFCRSLEVVSCRAKVARSRLLRSVSSSLRDCNFSHHAADTPFGEWYASSADRAFSFVVFRFLLKIFGPWIAWCEFSFAGSASWSSVATRRTSDVASTTQIESSPPRPPKAGCAVILRDGVSFWLI